MAQYLIQRSKTKHTTVWLTPPSLVEKLGTFDLDPCAAVGQKYKLAKRSFNVRTNGLRQRWTGRVFCNPPYDQPELSQFIERMIEHGNGTLLVLARTETRWFRRLWETADALLFVQGRVFYKRMDNVQSTPVLGSVLVAYGAKNVAALKSGKISGALVVHRGVSCISSK